MSSDWAQYFTQIEERLASIRVDLAWASHAGKTRKTTLVYVFTKMEQPREDGLSDEFGF